MYTTQQLKTQPLLLFQSFLNLFNFIHKHRTKIGIFVFGNHKKHFIDFDQLVLLPNVLSVFRFEKALQAIYQAIHRQSNVDFIVLNNNSIALLLLSRSNSCDTESISSDSFPSLL